MKKMFKVMDQHAASREVAEVKENGEILRRMLEILSEFCPTFCPTNLPEVPHLGRLLPNFCEKAGRLWHRPDANPTFLWCHHSASSTSRCSKHCLWGIDSPENVYRQMFTRCLQTNVFRTFVGKLPITATFISIVGRFLLNKSHKTFNGREKIKIEYGGERKRKIFSIPIGNRIFPFLTTVLFNCQ